MKSSHSRTFYLNFSWHTSLSIESHWGPREPLGGPLVPENSNKKTPQISLCPPLKWVTLSIPIVKSSHSRIFYLDFSRHTSLSFENYWGTIGDPMGPLTVSCHSTLVDITSWEVEIKYSTMGWFYYGNTEHYLRGSQRNTWRFEAFFLLFSGNEGPLNRILPFYISWHNC